MFEARQGKQLVVKVCNEIGVLLNVSKVVSEKGVSILALSAELVGDDCRIRLITDDNLRAKDALGEHGYDSGEEDVILVELAHKPGMLKRVTEVLADEKIDILSAYATALEQDERCLLVLHTANDEHALPRLHRAVAQ